MIPALNPTGQPLPKHMERVPAPEPFDMNAQWGERYTVGVDLGQSQDFTAICVVRRLEQDGGAKPIFQVGHLSRLPLNTTYPAIVAHVIGRMSHPMLRGKAELVIDYTGVGRPVFDLFRVQGVSPVGVSITGGSAISRDGPIWSVPKGHLISRVQALLHELRLKIHCDLQDAGALVAELQDFRVNFTDSGYAQFNARVGAHDDLVLALAIALWHSHGEHSSFDNWMGYARGGGWNYKTPEPPQAKIILKAPYGVTNVSTITGRSLNVGNDGTVELDPEDARPLIQSGWSVVEAQPDSI
jgi:hypothetical protein